MPDEPLTTGRAYLVGCHARAITVIVYKRDVQRDDPDLQGAFAWGIAFPERAPFTGALLISLHAIRPPVAPGEDTS